MESVIGIRSRSKDIQRIVSSHQFDRTQQVVSKKSECDTLPWLNDTLLSHPTRAHTKKANRTKI